MLISSVANAEPDLIWLMNNNDANGASSEYYVNNTLQKSADKRYVSAVLLTNYERPLIIDGKKALSVKSKVFYDCANIAMKPSDEIYYSEKNGGRQIVLKNSVDQQLTYFKVTIEKYASKIKMICSLEK